MGPCVGIEGICPPLCKYSDLLDGTYTLGQVMQFNVVMDELMTAYKKAQNNG